MENMRRIQIELTADEFAKFQEWFELKFHGRESIRPCTALEIMILDQIDADLAELKKRGA